MNNTRPKKSITLSIYTLPVFVLAGVFLLGFFLTSYKAFPGQYKGEVLSKKSSNTNSEKTKGNSDTAKNNKPVNTQGNVNKNKNITESDIPVDTIVEEVDEEITETEDETDEIIDEITNTPKWQTILFGTPYKNLGQLRSQLAKNTNTIRKINKEMVRNDGSGDQLMLQEKLNLAMVEQERIREVLQMSDGQFSILGWVFKMFGVDNGTGTDTDTDTDVDTDGTGEDVNTDGTGTDLETDGSGDTVETDGTVGGAKTSKTPGEAVDNSWEDSWMQ